MSLARITHKKKKNLFIHLMRSHFSLIAKSCVTLGTPTLNPPLHLFLPFLFLKSISQNKLSYEIMCCSTQCILHLLIIW